MEKSLKCLLLNERRIVCGGRKRGLDAMGFAERLAGTRRRSSAGATVKRASIRKKSPLGEFHHHLRCKIPLGSKRPNRELVLWPFRPQEKVLQPAQWARRERCQVVNVAFPGYRRYSGRLKQTFLPISLWCAEHVRCAQPGSPIEQGNEA